MDGAEVPESLDEWQQIQYPVEWDMAVIRDNYLNLNDDCSSPQQDPQAPENPRSEPHSLSSSSSEVDAEENRSSSRPRVVDKIGRRWRVRFEILRAGVFRLVSRVRNYVACAGGFWSSASGTGVAAAVLLSFLYMRVQRWRQRVHQERKDRLFFLIRERDEKISQLHCRNE